MVCVVLLTSSLTGVVCVGVGGWDMWITECWCVVQEKRKEHCMHRTQEAPSSPSP